MPNYTIPGVAITKYRARLAGLVAAVLAVLLVVAWTQYTNADHGDRLRIQLRTDQVGAGIVPGTNVRVEGVAVGTVAEVISVGDGRQLLTLDLEKSQIAGLTETFTVDYAPENLFGISAVTLRPGSGGTPLHAEAVIDMVGRVADVTMGALLRELTRTSTDVLTPKLAELLRQFSGDLKAFTPILQAVVTLSRAVADTQQYPSSYLLDQYASFFQGLGVFSSSTLKLLKSLLDIEVFQHDRARYDVSIGMVVDQAFPAIAGLLNTAQVHFNGYTDMFTPLLGAVAATVPTPDTSRADLTELIARLDRIFADTPNGPVVNLGVTLRGVPGVAVPLLGQQALEALGGAR
ncbi:MCE family protein [Nocardia uniformis]|uniref:MCE family protein n=1 Tax=Nocardia uniformis TaxID=53432 RepID=A0A849C512_9NOCA|nr:MlaD family protein [Nocardia uniformis]NNH72746.1 MCE family protein [Nocardia uniformis]